MTETSSGPSELAVLAGKHINLTYYLLGILLVVILIGCGGAYLASRWVDKEISKAEASQQATLALQQTASNEEKAWEVQYAKDNSQRTIDEQKIADLQKQLDTRDTTAAQKVQQVLQPGRTAQQAYSDLSSQYKLTSPSLVNQSPDGTEQTLTFYIPDVQQFTAAKIDDVAKTADNQDKDAEIASQADEITSLNVNITAGKQAYDAEVKTETQCEKTVSDYKKAATVSKWQKFKNGAEKALLFAAGVALGHRL
jgi:type II secretory pathway pseudopilin PulG